MALFPRHPPFDRTPYLEDTGGSEDSIPEVTPQEVLAAGERFKPGKAPGPDGIPVLAVKLLLKEYPESVAAAATEMLRTGLFPTAWKAADLVLIPKGPGSYRPICLLGSLAKAFESIVEARLQEFAEKNGLLSEVQYGFR